LRLRDCLPFIGGAQQQRRHGRVVRLHLGRHATRVHRLHAREEGRVLPEAHRVGHHHAGGDQHQQQRGDPEGGEGHAAKRLHAIPVLSIFVKVA